MQGSKRTVQTDPLPAIANPIRAVDPVTSATLLVSFRSTVSPNGKPTSIWLIHQPSQTTRTDSGLTDGTDQRLSRLYSNFLGFGVFSCVIQFHAG